MHPKSAKELLVGGRFLERVQRRPVDVLEKRIAQQVRVLCGTHHGRDGVPPQALRRPEPALTGHEFEPGHVVVSSGLSTEA